VTKGKSKFFGPLLALIVVIFIAIISIIRPEKIQSITGSVWFFIIGVIIAIRSLSAIFTISDASRIRRRSSVIIHLGIVIGLIGVFTNERSHKNGYIFLELAGSGKNIYLTKNFKAIDELPFNIRLDSITSKSIKGFQDAPNAWINYTTDHQSVSSFLTYNHPANYQGCQLLLSNLIEPGFPHSYELLIDNDQYQLLHNQKVELPNKLILWSFAYDTDEKQIGLLINNQEHWFQIGESKQINNSVITIQSIDFAQNQGVIFLVKNLRLRPVIFIGFALMLIGLVPLIFEKRIL
jgi:hypothetical protein